MRRIGLLVGGAMILAMAGCATDGGGSASLGADLRDSGGRTLVRATLSPAGSAIRVRVEAAGLPAGNYAAHIHAVGRCDPPDFTSAGPHWNPTGRQHGRLNPMGPHLGDLPNLNVGADGAGSVEFVVPGASLGRGSRGLSDGDGTALVVHAGPDDYRTDPSGNSGARLACGVIAAPR